MDLREFRLNAFGNRGNQIADLGIVIFLLFVLPLLEDGPAPPVGHLENQSRSLRVPVENRVIPNDLLGDLDSGLADKEVLGIGRRMMKRERPHKSSHGKDGEHRVEPLVRSVVPSQHGYRLFRRLVIVEDRSCGIQVEPVSALLELCDKLVREIVRISNPEIQRLKARLSFEPERKLFRRGWIFVGFRPLLQQE